MNNVVVWLGCFAGLILLSKTLFSNQLHDAIEAGNKQTFWELALIGDEKLLNGQDCHFQQSPLHLALSRGQLDMVFILVSHPLVKLDLLNGAGNSVEKQAKISFLIEELAGNQIIWAIQKRILVESNSLSSVFNAQEREGLNNNNSRKIEESQVNLAIVEDVTIVGGGNKRLRPQYRDLSQKDHGMSEIELEIEEEGNLTLSLRNFRSWALENKFSRETFLREDHENISDLVNFLFQGRASFFLREQIASLALKSLKCKVAKRAECERKIIALIGQLKIIFLAEIKNGADSMNRYFHGLRFIFDEILGPEIAEELMISMIFLRFINPSLLANKTADLKTATVLSKCLQRTVSGQDEKGGQLAVSKKFIEGNNKRGLKVRSLLKEFMGIVYKSSPIAYNHIFSQSSSLR
jgi:hypothetical protein